MLAWLLDAGCGDPEDLADEAEQARGLTFMVPVPVRHISRTEFAAEEQARIARVPDADLQSYANTYGRLGYFPIDLDLRPILATVRTDSVAAYYSSDTQSISLLGDVSHSTIVHEFVHALQDQNLGLSSDGDAMTSDAIAARNAVSEGDAVLAELHYLASVEGLDFATVSLRHAFDSFTAFTESRLHQPAAPLFYARSSFAYTYGLRYCAANLMGATDDRPVAQRPAPFDWRREDALFGDAAPITTQGVLTLQPVAAPAVGIDDVPAVLADRFEFVDRDSLGAWYVFLLLVPLEHCSACSLSGATRDLVSGWRGDSVLFVRQRDTGANGLVWVSSWADGGVAEQLASAAAELHGFAARAGDARSGQARDGEPMWIEVRGTRVVVIKNIDPSVAPAFVEAAMGPSAAVAATTTARRPRSRPSLAALLSAR